MDRGRGLCSTRRCRLAGRTTLWISVAVALVLTVANPRSAPAATVLRLTSALGTDHPDVICLEQFVKEVAKRTNGEVDIRLFANNALGAPLGTIDMALLASSNIDKYSRPFAMMAVPYMHDDLAHAHRTLDGPALGWFTDEGRKAGFELVALNFEFGFRMTSNNRRLINTPADFKGLKIRIPPEPQSRSIMQAFGAIPQVVAFPDTYLALANNAIDGAELPISGMISQKWYEVQKFMSMTNHIYVHQMVIANSQVWSKLKPEWQKIIREEAVAAGARARKMVADQEKDYIAQMEKAGIKFSYPDLAPFRALAGPSHAELKKWIGDDAWSKYVGYVEAARKK